MQTSRRHLLANGILLLVLGGSTWARHTAASEVAARDFLAPLSLPFRGLVTRDVPLTQSELDLLEPDAILVRRYSEKGPDGLLTAELAVTAGHRKRSVHTPGFCLQGGGWETLSQETGTVRIEGRDIPVTRLLSIKSGAQLLVMYFFTDGEFHTRSLPEYQWKQFWARVGGRMPLGALVRVSVPVLTTPQQAGELADAFAAATVPGVLRKLTEVRLASR